ncbi:MAG: NADH-quinone oxidoreductase subunit M, partial [Verrucomicrobia bacterium]|nr:NADH-quinone oxidoreductase subunit M [Verrucomicrobiota bacterium]
MSILTHITFWPLIAGILVVGLQDAKRARCLTLASNLLTLALGLVLWRRFDVSNGGLQFVEKHEWIPSLGVNYFVGADGLGLLMVMLTS